MGGQSSKSSGEQSSIPGTLSPITATLFSLFGPQAGVSSGQFVPTGFGQGGVFNPAMFGALPGLLAGQPLSGTEQAILGTGAPSAFQLPTGAGAVTQAAPGVGAVGPSAAPTGQKGGARGAAVTPEMAQAAAAQGMTPEQLQALGGPAFGGGIQGLGLQNALLSQGLLNQASLALPGLLNADPAATIAQARQEFQTQTLPGILERAPGFSSSDLEREMLRAGTELETGVAAAREQARVGVARDVMQGLPAFAQAVGGNLLDQASNVLGFGNLGREFIREQSPAGDAFRVLSMLQSLTGPGITNVQLGTQKSKSGGGGI